MGGGLELKYCDFCPKACTIHGCVLSSDLQASSTTQVTIFSSVVTLSYQFPGFVQSIMSEAAEDKGSFGCFCVLDRLLKPAARSRTEQTTSQTVPHLECRAWKSFQIPSILTSSRSALTKYPFLTIVFM